MKKILFVASLLVSLVLLNSCSVDEDGSPAFVFDFIPVDSVEMPQTFDFGSTHTISVTYKRPTSCHSFSNFQYEQESGNVRKVAIVNFVTLNNDCETLVEEFQTESFNFNVLDSDTYTFRFWQGRDSQGQNMYLEYEVPVNTND